MPNDVPAFMKRIDTSDLDDDLSTVPAEGEEQPEENAQPTNDEEAEQPQNEENESEQEETTDDEQKDENEQPEPSDESEKTDEQEEVKEQEAKETEKKQEPEKEEKELIAKDDRIAELEEQVKLLTEAVENAGAVLQPKTQEQKQQELDEISQQVQELYNKPVIRPSHIPNPRDYMNDDGFDMESFMRDTLTSFALDIQRNIVGGPIAAVQFNILKQGLNQSLKQSKADTEAELMVDKLYKNYPVFKDDEELEQSLEMMITGYYSKMKAEGKNEPLTYETLEKFATKLLAAKPPKEPVKKTQEKVEPAKTGTPMNPSSTTRQPDEMEDVISGMLKAKQTRGLSFLSENRPGF